MIVSGVSWPLFADIDVGNNVVAPVITGLVIALVVGTVTVLVRLVRKINVSGLKLDQVSAELTANSEVIRAIARNLDAHTLEMNLHLAEAKHRDELIERQAAENSALRVELAGTVTRIAVLESRLDTRPPRLEGGDD